MSQTILAQTTAELQTPAEKLKVYEYALTVVNPTDNDAYTWITAFRGTPSPQDWQRLLSGWNSCGYSLATQPLLIRTI